MMKQPLRGHVCTDICTNYAGNGKCINKYTSTVKYCTHCSSKIIGDFIICPCCKLRLRSKTRIHGVKRNE